MGVENTNPWAEFGLNPDGTPLETTSDDNGDKGGKGGDDNTGDKDQPDLSAVIQENAALKTRVAAFEEKVKGIPATFEGMQKKLALLDKVIEVLGGKEGGDEPDHIKYRAVYEDFKKIASPGVRAIFDAAEKDPDIVRRLTGAVTSMQGSHLQNLNAQAHTRLLGLAKKSGWKAETDADLAELIFPFELTVSKMIESNPNLHAAFLAGDMEIVDDLFRRVTRSHIASRLREKQKRIGVTAPRAVGRGGAKGTEGEGEPKKPDIKTPQGRMTFHRQAVGKWLDRAAQRGGEEE